MAASVPSTSHCASIVSVRPFHSSSSPCVVDVSLLPRISGPVVYCAHGGCFSAVLASYLFVRHRIAMKASLLNAVCELRCTIEKEIYVTKRKKPRLLYQTPQALDRHSNGKILDLANMFSSLVKPKAALLFQYKTKEKKEGRT